MSPDAAIDCHLHIIGAPAQYPLDPKRRYTPAEASAPDYWKAVANTAVGRIVIVQPSFYGTDNSCLVDALREAGGRARGVAVLDASDMTDGALQILHEAGVRGIRINTLSNRSGARPLADALGDIGDALKGSGWHIQVLCDPQDFALLTEIQDKRALPLVLDHFGFLTPNASPDDRAGLLRLVDGGAWIKLSGTDRLGSAQSGPWFRDLATEIGARAPDRIVWGSDWPHTPLHSDVTLSAAVTVPSRKIDTVALFRTAAGWFEDADLRRRFLSGNASALYDFQSD